jgi:hypothetical protein
MQPVKSNPSSRLPRLILAGAGALALCALGAAPTQSCGPPPGGGSGGTEGGTTPPVCGDGVISGMEQCDGTNINQTCSSLGGTLRCDPRTCTLDTRQCVRAVCGNGRIEGNEACEGTNVQGATCGGGQVGTVRCNARFCELDYSDCKPATCGDGRRDNEHEECDGQDLGAATCQNSVDPNATGTLRCTSNCRFDTRFCIERPGSCGDGIVQEPYETCEGDTPCQEFALSEGRPADYYLPGFVPCSPTLCRRDGSLVSQYCQVNQSRCGNGIIEPLYGETCDGTNIGFATCLAGGFLFGVPRCTTECQLHYFSGCTGGCVPAGRGMYCQ